MSNYHTIAIDRILAGFEAQDREDEFNASVEVGREFAPEFEVISCLYSEGEHHYIIIPEVPFRNGFMKDLREVENISFASIHKPTLLFVSVKHGASIRDIIYSLYVPF